MVPLTFLFGYMFVMNNVIVFFRDSQAKSCFLEGLQNERLRSTLTSLRKACQKACLPLDCYTMMASGAVKHQTHAGMRLKDFYCFVKSIIPGEENIKTENQICM